MVGSGIKRDNSVGLPDTVGNCQICSAAVDLFDSAIVLDRHSVKYYRCSGCGRVFTEHPHWLQEAYSSAMTSIDIGPLSRCINASHIIRSIILSSLDRHGEFLDFGAGYGLLVRRMRDLGFNFKAFDAHCENIFAKGHEADPDAGRFELITAFEVFEHLVDPVATFGTLAKAADNLLISTYLLPTVAPKVGKWWYYGPEHGQHISFFTEAALREMARPFGMTVHSLGEYHFFTRSKMSRVLFSLCARSDTSPALGYILSRAKGVKSLLGDDFEKLSSFKLY